MWPRAVIRTLAEKAKSGIKLFVDHNDDSSHNNRDSVGEVVASITRKVKDKLQAIALTVVDTVDTALDVCSIEADVDFSAPGIAGDVSELTGIALGSSKVDSPAFPGAVRMASLQCFGADDDLKDKKDKPPAKEGDSEVKFSDVLNAIKEMKIYPHQLYSQDELKEDRFVKEIVEKNETLTKELETSNTKLKELDEAGKEKDRKVGLSDAKSRFEKLFPEGITDLTKDYMSKKFNPETIEDLSDAGLKSAFENLQKQYSEDAKMFGSEEKTEASGGPSGGESEKGESDPIDSAVDALMEE